MGSSTPPAPAWRLPTGVHDEVAGRTVLAGGRPHEDPPLMVGAIVGVSPRYRIERLLGEGGMGRVYRARREHGGPEESVALKLLRKDLTAEHYAPEALARFRQEAEAASRIAHPGIVKVYDHQRLQDGRALIAMELLEGESLEAWMLRGAPLGAGLLVLADVAAALHVAHAGGVIHRDIKPANVFLHGPPEVRRPKLLDFGIAKVERSEHTKIETVVGTVLGTPLYIAPERALARPLDPRADLYSLGIILYEMLTGRVPFVSDRAMEVLGMHIKAPPLDPRLAAPGRAIPEGLAQWTLKLLAKDPQERPQTGNEVAAVLRRWAADPAVASARIGLVDAGVVDAETMGLAAIAERPTSVPGLQARVIPSPSRAAPTRGRRRVGWLVLVALGVVSIAAWSVLRGLPAPADPEAPRADAPEPTGTAVRSVSGSEAPASAPRRPVEQPTAVAPSDAAKAPEAPAPSPAADRPVSEAPGPRVAPPPAVDTGRAVDDKTRTRAPARRPRARPAAAPKPNPTPALPAFKDDVYSD